MFCFVLLLNFSLNCLQIELENRPSEINICWNNYFLRAQYACNCAPHENLSIFSLFTIKEFGSLLKAKTRITPNAQQCKFNKYGRLALVMCVLDKHRDAIIMIPVSEHWMPCRISRLKKIVFIQNECEPVRRFDSNSGACALCSVSWIPNNLDQILLFSLLLSSKSKIMLAV